MAIQNSMVLEASLESQPLEQGLRRVRGDLRQTQTEATKAEGSFQGMQRATKGLAGTLIGVGTAGLTALTTLATGSPAVADEMAKIKNEIRELSFVAGEQLEPVFKKVADDVLPGITDALRDGDSAFSTLVNTASESIGDISKLLSGEGAEIENKFAKLFFAATGAGLGSLIGRPGAGAAGGLLLENASREERAQIDLGFNPTTGEQFIDPRAVEQGVSGFDPAFFPGFVSFIRKIFGEERERDVQFQVTEGGGYMI